MISAFFFSLEEIDLLEKARDFGRLDFTKNLEKKIFGLYIFFCFFFCFFKGIYPSTHELHCVLNNGVNLEGVLSPIHEFKNRIGTELTFKKHEK